MFSTDSMIPCKNNEETRVCHKCKGQLDIRNIYVYYSSWKNENRMELDCYRCKTVYYLEDDQLVGVQMEEGGIIFTKPFF